VGIQPGPKTPEGVYARVVDGRTLYVNTTEEEKDVVVGVKAHGVLSHQSYNGKMELGPYQVDLVE
jgi:beta-galactosidase